MHVCKRQASGENVRHFACLFLCSPECKVLGNQPKSMPGLTLGGSFVARGAFSLDNCSFIVTVWHGVDHEQSPVSVCQDSCMHLLPGLQRRSVLPVVLLFPLLKIRSVRFLCYVVPPDASVCENRSQERRVIHLKSWQKERMHSGNKSEGSFSRR